MLISGCSPASDQKAESERAHRFFQEPSSLSRAVEQEARDVEGKLIDGWYFSQDSRSLKSNYRAVDPATKARFACDYMDWLQKKRQNLEVDWQSYVPYSERSKFASWWWSDPAHCTSFIKEPYYKQIIWLHEALMDGSELWFRALERDCPAGVTSMQVLAHDSEQQLVSKYKENESSPEKSFSSFAPQVQASQEQSSSDSASKEPRH
jgi:hypothetical protein